MFPSECISNISGIVSSAISSKLPSLATSLLDGPDDLFHCQAEGFLGCFEAGGFHFYPELGRTYRVDFYLASTRLAYLLRAHQCLLDYLNPAWLVACYRNGSSHFRPLKTNLALRDLSYRLSPFLGQ